MSNETTPERRRAVLKVKATETSSGWPVGLMPHFVGLYASNGEPLMNGEQHPTLRMAERGREAVIRAMIEVLEDEGYTVTAPTPE